METLLYNVGNAPPCPAAWHWIGRNWALIAIAVTCLSLVLFVVLLMAKYVRICLNLFMDTRPVGYTPLDFQIPHGREVRFRSFDGSSLRGMHINTPNRAAYKGTIIFCHEYNCDMYSCARYTRPLVEAGFDVFTFDFRGHGQSSCGGKYRPLQWPSDKELEDVLGACGYVESYLSSQGRSPQIGIFGVSRGAGAALLAAASDPNIKAIVCDGAFNTATTVIALMKRWAHIFARVHLAVESHPEFFWKSLFWLVRHFAQPRLSCRFLSVRKALQEMQPRPILFIHGQRDSYISVDQTRLLYSEAPCPKYIWIVPGAQHNQSVVVAPDEYAARTIAFFRRHLAGETIEESKITSPVEAEVA